jgi:perosamine synthetase
VIVTGGARIAAAIERQYRGVPRATLRDGILGWAKSAAMCAFIRPSLYWIPASLPFLRLGETIYPTRIVIRRLSGMHAGLMHRMRARLDRARHARRRASSELTRRLGFAPREDGDRHPYLRLPAYAATPEAATRLSALAHRDGLGVARGYPSAVSEIPALRERFRGQRFPRATRVSDHLLTLPTHHWLAESDITAIVDRVRGVVGVSCPPDAAVVFEREGA